MPLPNVSVKRIVEPSGDQTGDWTSICADDGPMPCGLEPSAFITQIRSLVLPPRANASFVPSGDHATSCSSGPA